VGAVEKKFTGNSAATAATTVTITTTATRMRVNKPFATRIRVNKASLNSLNLGGKIGLLGLRIAHSTAKKVDMTMAAIVATAKR
jgi:hypothetical protein